MQGIARNGITGYFWLWALLPLLLVCLLTIPRLDEIAFYGDEPSSLLDGAGVHESGPQSIPEIFDQISPEQTLGWPVTLFIWVRLAGRSEVAVRLLPFLAGLLAHAMVYRAGRDFFSPKTGLLALLLLSSAMFPQTNMLHARSFPMVLLFAILSLWAYWRIALQPKPVGWREQAGLMLGAAGILYSHYFAALLLPVMSLFHLFFVPKDRRWWRPVLLLGAGCLTTLIQLPLFLQGLSVTADGISVSRPALLAPQLLAQFFQYLVNGIVDPPFLVGLLLAVLLPTGLVIAILLLQRARVVAGAVWYLVFVSVTLLLVYTIANEALKVVTERRMRYLMALWPPLALLAGYGLCRLYGSHRWLATGLLAFWLLLGTWLGLATGYRYELGFFNQTEVHLAYRAVDRHVPASEALVIDSEVSELEPEPYYLLLVDTPLVVYNRRRDDPLKHVLRLHAEYHYLWLLFHTQDKARMEAIASGLGRVICERVQVAGGFTLTRHALSPVHCPDSSVRLAFDSDIQLTGPDIRLEDGRLLLYAGFRSSDTGLLANYSLAVHLIDVNSGERVDQGDVGIGPGAFVPVSSEIDVSGLPPGDYEVRVALYDWQTGVRLQARDLETDEVSDMHTLHRFRIG